MGAALAVVAISVGILALVADRRPGQGHADCTRLFFRCLGWGLSIGAATGGLIGALVILVSGLGTGTGGVPALAPVGAIYGIVVGSLVAVIPSVLGAPVVTGVISWRHPQPAAENEVANDLRVIFGAVAALLNTALLVGLAAGGADIASVASSLPLIVAGNACVVLLLCRARPSIARSRAKAVV